VGAHQENSQRIILTSIALVIAGPTVAEQLAARMQLGEAFKWSWWILQWPVVLVLVATGIGIVYYFAPDAEQEWVWITPESILATVAWLAVSLGLNFYILRFANYNETYGAIGGVIVLLLWFWLTGLAILIGAEFNAEIEHASPYGKDVGEKVPGRQGRQTQRRERRSVRGQISISRRTNPTSNTATSAIRADPTAVEAACSSASTADPTSAAAGAPTGRSGCAAGRWRTRAGQQERGARGCRRRGAASARIPAP